MKATRIHPLLAFPLFGLIIYLVLEFITFLFNIVIHIFTANITMAVWQTFVVLIVINIIGSFLKSK